MQDSNLRKSRVTPCMGVWIETDMLKSFVDGLGVTPCMGVWIETRIKHRQIADRYKSHPVWVCGLKPIITY